MRPVPCLLAALVLTGCAVGPDFAPPKPLAITDWHDTSARSGRMVAETTNPDPDWWKGFNDPVLTALIDKAVSGNLDLQQAVMRVVESRQNQAAARAAGLPTISGNGSYMREQLGLRGLLESQGIGTGDTASIAGDIGGLTQPVNLFQYGLSASWELDLFGRVRRSEEGAKANTQAQIDATADALVMLEGQVAQAYVQLRGAQALTASQQENVRIAQAAYDLTHQRQLQGLTTDLDAEQARTQLATTQSQLPAYQKQAEQAMNRLSVLTGQPPGALDAMLAGSAPLPQPPAMIGIGVPSTLARRRPDIREAEAKLHAATANVGIAVASFYPDVSLTGSFGLRALDGAYLTNWASAFYAFGPSVSLPIFQGGKLTANLRMARARQVEAALAYRGTVLNALREVEDALVAYRTDTATRDRIAIAAQAGQTTLYLARNSYAHGLTDFIQVLDAERTLTGINQQLVQANVALLSDVVSLYGALGGGWQAQVGALTTADAPSAVPVAPAAADALAAGTAKD